MARKNSVASRDYAPGTYGPFAVDGFLSSDTDFLVLTLTVENWPTAAPLITGTMLWDNGAGTNFTINSPVRDRAGVPQTTATIRIGVPQGPDGKISVTGGNVTLTALQPLRTAITLDAVAVV